LFPLHGRMGWEKKRGKGRSGWINIERRGFDAEKKKEAQSNPLSTSLAIKFFQEGEKNKTYRNPPNKKFRKEEKKRKGPSFFSSTNPAFIGRKKGKLQIPANLPLLLLGEK